MIVCYDRVTGFFLIMTSLMHNLSKDTRDFFRDHLALSSGRIRRAWGRGWWLQAMSLERIVTDWEEMDRNTRLADTCLNPSVLSPFQLSNTNLLAFFPRGAGIEVLLLLLGITPPMKSLFKSATIVCHYPPKAWTGFFTIDTHGLILMVHTYFFFFFF